MSNPGLHVLAFLVFFAGTVWLGIGGFLWAFQVEKTAIDGEEMDLVGAKFMLWASVAAFLLSGAVWLAADFF